MHIFFASSRAGRPILSDGACSEAFQTILCVDDSTMLNDQHIRHSICASYLTYNMEGLNRQMEQGP